MTRDQLAEEVTVVIQRMRDQVTNVNMATGALEKRWPNNAFVQNTASAAKVMGGLISDLEKLVGAYAVSKESGAVQG
jgi:hypothetical protein